MDLGIAGRKAIVCASSRGLGRACAQALAQAGYEVVINGRDAKRVEATAAEIANATGAKTHAVTADVASAEGQAALFTACPEPDILINNNAGPPPRDFRTLSREQMIEGVIANMIVAIELTQKAADPMVRRRFGRIINITSGGVKMPLPGLDLSSGARRPYCIHGRRGPQRRRGRCHNQQHVAWRFRYRSIARDAAAHRDPKGGRRSRLRPPPGSPACRRGASVSRPSSAPFAPSCARPMPATSPGRIY